MAKGCRKKSYFLNDSAIKRDVGGGERPCHSEKKIILLPFKKKNTLDSLSTYGHITLKFVGRYFSWFVTIFYQKIGPFQPKNWEEKKIVRIRFRLFQKKKKKILLH